MIVVEALTKRFGDVQAVDNVSFSAANGRVTALLGPNSAGKSTTLRILSTVIRADTGNARVDDADVAGDPLTVRRQIGVLPHGAGLYDRLSAVENVRYYGKLHGLNGAALQQRIDDLVEQLDMADFAERRVAGFSQGQKIKVALARALVHDPRNVVLDEPTNGLDVMATRALREIILTLKEQGRCVLFSSHVMQEVANLCDDVVIIARGQARFEGTLAALRASAGTDDLEDAFVQVVAAADAELGATP